MRSVVITGGSRGIGAAMVRRFTAGGDRVYFLYASAVDSARALEAETGAVAIQCDVSDEAQVRGAFAQIPRVDVLINNAGIADWGPINWVEPDRFRPSMWGLTGASCEAAYAASKAAVIGLTKSLAKELGPSGIRVNAAAPGVIQTDMLKNLSSEDLEALRLETPLETLGHPEDVAETMWFLASPAASFITGEVLNVSGGFVI